MSSSSVNRNLIVPVDTDTPVISNQYLAWRFRLEDHMWYLAHNCIRLDLNDMLIILDNLLLAKGMNAYKPWMTKNLQQVWDIMSQFLDEHTMNEDEIIFPYMRTKVIVSDAICEEHLYQSKLHKTLDSKISSLHPEEEVALETLTSIRKVIADLKTSLGPHLLEEETDLLPKLLISFDTRDLDIIEAKIKLKGKWWTLPHIYRHMDDVQVKQHMTQVLAIPNFVQNWILGPNFKKYKRVVSRCIDELKDPSLRSVSSGKGCTIA